MKTNPEYAKLAYRRTILTEVVALVRRNFIADDTSEQAARTLVCEEVMQIDSVVPAEGFADYVEELEAEIKELGLEMRQFEFRRKTDEPPAKQTTKASAKGSAAEDAPTGKKRGKAAA